ncbi:uncharacterized mitochondrial protein AtMg00860-like [Physcomitrium patens]|uniref:uncharacterized mitochondrial protein AtMg00860-like n=1 Tax=Physcomitrium patens TaxID=3218 RepID=UPI003CCE4183
MEIFLDDFCAFGTRLDHLNCLGKCLAQCAKFGISLNSDKCQFGVPSGKLLGHIVSSRGIATDPDKVTHIMNLPRPETVSGVRGFVGYISYYPRFIRSFAVICQPLTNLLKKPPLHGTGPIWTLECIVAFEALKSKLKDDQGLDHPIYYASRQLVAAERNDTTTEREALGMIYSVQKF